MRRIAALLLLLSAVPLPAPAVERAPRISDREIIESLAQLKAGQTLLQQRLESLQREMDKRFEAADKRFEAVDKRFEAMDRRIGDLHSTLIAFFGAMMAILVALFGYIVWDRRTALRPVQDRLERLETEVIQDLELHHAAGSRFERLFQALRALAREDDRLAGVLRQFSLL